MRSRLRVLLEIACFSLATMVGVKHAEAAPEAKILRIDPLASQSDGAPIISMVVEIAQQKRIGEATQDCAVMTGNARLSCLGEKLAVPRALFTPFDFPPKENAKLLVRVDNADQPATFVDKYKWGESQNVKGVGTAWLIVLDAASSMGSQFGEAQQVAQAFINSMGPQDIANVVVISDNPMPIGNSKWKPAASKAELLSFVQSSRLAPASGRARPLFTAVRNAATDSFKDLGNAGSTLQVPLHQAMVVLSNGSAGADTLSTGAGATQLNQYLTKGRFPEDNTASPKMPLPVISILFPTSGLSEELIKNSQDFMYNLANTEIGGYFGVVRGNAAAVGAQAVNAVRDRFNQMFLVRWRVSCLAPTLTQSFSLVFNDVNPMIAPDASFANVPMGIDPTTWPLDIDAAYTADRAKSSPVYPGGDFTIYGRFCSGSDTKRMQAYFLPANAQIPQTSLRDPESARKYQQQLAAMGMVADAVKAGDGFIQFKAPDNEKIVLGSGSQAISRVVVYDSVAKRLSGTTATSIISIKASTDKPVSSLIYVAAGFGGLVIILLVIAIVRGGGGKGKGGGGGGGMRPAPVPVPPQPGGFGGGAPPGGFGPPGGGYGGPQGGGYGGAPGGYGGGAPPAGGGYGGGAPPGGGYGAASVNAAGTAIAPVAVAPAQAPGAANPDFLYGGKPPQYGLTTGQPLPVTPPPDPYAGGGIGAPPANVSRATLSGSAGVFTVLPGSEMRVGRDAAQCQIVFHEPRVSGVHGAVKLEGGSLFVRDEGSNNGTHVNGAKITAGAWTPVPAGSMLRFGPVELSVSLSLPGTR